MSVAKNPNERRNGERMSIEREVHYRVMSKKEGDAEGLGRTLNISSSGVLFTAQHMLPPGRRVEVSISWPAQLDNKCALKLVARGRVVRYGSDCVALEIMQHEFRTKSNRASA